MRAKACLMMKYYFRTFAGSNASLLTLAPSRPLCALTRVVAQERGPPISGLSMKRNSITFSLLQHDAVTTTPLRVDESSHPQARGPRAHGGGCAAPTATEG